MNEGVKRMNTAGSEETFDEEILHPLHLCQQEILDYMVKVCSENGLRYYLFYGTLIGAIRHQGPIPWDDDLDVVMPRKDWDRFKELLLSRPADDRAFHIHCHDNDPNYPEYFLRLTKAGTVFRTKYTDSNDFNNKEVWIDVYPLDEAPLYPKTVGRLCGNYIKLLRRLTLNKTVKNTGYLGIKGKLIHFLLTPVPEEKLRKYTDSLMKKWDRNKGGYVINWTSAYGYARELLEKDLLDPPVCALYGGKEYSVPKEWDTVLRIIYGDYMSFPPQEERKGHHALEIKL